MYEDMPNYFNFPGAMNTYMGDPYNFNPNMYGYNPYSYNVPNRLTEKNLQNYYPDIYNVVYPMVKKAVARNNMNISEDIISSIVDEVYSNVEMEEKSGLKDLIQILVVREFVGKSTNSGQYSRPRYYGSPIGLY